MRTVTQSVLDPDWALESRRALATLEAARRAINRVHGIGETLDYAFESFDNPDGPEGMHSPETRVIFINEAAHFKMSAVVHEVAHALDASRLSPEQEKVLYGSDLAVLGKGMLKGWLDAVQSSPEYGVLQKLRNDSTALEWARNRAALWVAPHELWARSYEQFIAIHAEDADLSRELKEQQEDTFEIEGHAVSLYWQHDSFVRIDSAIRAAFELLGWM